ncbi:type I restriction-modification system subunit M [Parafannyhessea umbonata]|uniref:site-specific DNA-methyltransferase (adenine-specific) n=1 Tax=Parafannyhessea umbonata TaxID=604330 RepID=A0A1H1LXE1_9ACTN|nr:type I restriction-modification system subunit M [Parafannyhessea umbonata]SDR79216.1 type I restriction enzyme M protein [Parafannyhessea umbonata]
MNKQQLARRIWRAANKMRSKIEASEYKDYILGFIFYRFLSEQEERFCLSEKWTHEDLEQDLNEDNTEDAEHIRNNLGYFISYQNLYSTWLASGSDFSVDNVRIALSAFSRNISPNYRDTYEGIFRTLESGLSNLGSTIGQQTKAVSDLLALIQPIPMDDKQGYDVLGYIYEYLIRNFAGNAGKKAGEFYTPHEVANVMSQIIAYNLRGRDELSIYDPTSGSASLLITVGAAIAQESGNPEGIRYYAQELKSNTYNLTRMNLVMHGIKPANIVTRNADTLEEDWPLRADDKQEADSFYSDEPLRVDACMSNPPYSQSWNAKDREGDPRFDGYGIAPKGKADYAFLLHNLYHLKPGGILTIVLPHGVLFRGDSEGDIRRALVDRNEISAIIGLPPDIFYGTSIPTIVMVLTRHDEAKGSRGDGSVLIIDASKHFEKSGTKNRLRAADVKRIVDAYKARRDIPGLCRVVPKDEIVRNDYNLNIPRYVDATERPERWDLYATMFGGIPTTELDDLNNYWEALPGLRESVFLDKDGYCQLRQQNLDHLVRSHPSVSGFAQTYRSAFAGFAEKLEDSLVNHVQTVDLSSEENAIADDVFDRLGEVPLVDRYSLYQKLDLHWSGRDDEQGIAGDIELIQSEGQDAVRKVDQHLVLKKVKNDNGDDEEREVVDAKEPWVGHILPFSLVQETKFPADLAAIRTLNEKAASATSSIDEIFDSLDEEEREGDYTNEDCSDFAYKTLYESITRLAAEDNDEIDTLMKYLDLLKEQSAVLKDIPKGDKQSRKAAKDKAKREKVDFISNHNDVRWDSMKATGGVYAASRVKERVSDLIEGMPDEEDSLLGKLRRVARLNDERKKANADAKQASAELTARTKEAIESLGDDEARSLLYLHWVQPIINDINAVPGQVIDGLVKSIRDLDAKYSVTLSALAGEREVADESLCDMIPRLTGTGKQTAALHELESVLGGESK